MSLWELLNLLFSNTRVHKVNGHVQFYWVNNSHHPNVYSCWKNYWTNNYLISWNIIVKLSQIEKYWYCKSAFMNECEWGQWLIMKLLPSLVSVVLNKQSATASLMLVWTKIMWQDRTRRPNVTREIAPLLYDDATKCGRYNWQKK